MKRSRSQLVRKIALLGVLYFCQGLPFGFQATALPIYLRASGVSLTGIAFLGALSLPWLLKVLWSPLVDRFGSTRFGRRKSWIAPMQLCLALTCGAAAFVPPTGHLGLLLGLVFLMNLAAATQDIAVDGLAVDLLGKDELGPGNAAQVVGYKIGMLTGGGLLVYVSRWVGWQGLFTIMAALVLAVFLVTLFMREPARKEAAGEPAPNETLQAIMATVTQVFRTPAARWVLIAIVTYKLGESMLDAMFKPFLVDVGFEPAVIGLWVGTYGMAASLSGSAFGGWLARRVPLWRALALAAALRVVPLAAQTLIAFGTPGPTTVIVVTCAEHFFGGIVTTVLFAFMMSQVDRRIGATHYTVLASLEVLGKFPGAWSSGPLAEGIGYGWTFAIGTALALAYLPVLGVARKRNTVPPAPPAA